MLGGRNRLHPQPPVNQIFSHANELYISKKPVSRRFHYGGGKNCEQKPTASRDRTDSGLSRRHYNRCNLLGKIVPDFQKETRDG